jgi:hypothetical protein
VGTLTVKEKDEIQVFSHLWEPKGEFWNLEKPFEGDFQEILVTRSFETQR